MSIFNKKFFKTTETEAVKIANIIILFELDIAFKKTQNGHNLYSIEGDSELIQKFIMAFEVYDA